MNEYTFQPKVISERSGGPMPEDSRMLTVKWSGVFTSCRQDGHLPPLPVEGIVLCYTLQKPKWSLPACEGLRIQFKLKGNWPWRWPSPLPPEKGTAHVQLSGPMRYSRGIWSRIRVILGARKRRLTINGLSSVGGIAVAASWIETLMAVVNVCSFPRTHLRAGWVGLCERMLLRGGVNINEVREEREGEMRFGMDVCCPNEKVQPFHLYCCLDYYYLSLLQASEKDHTFNFYISLSGLRHWRERVAITVLAP